MSGTSETQGGGQPRFAEYAAVYDLIYRDKDYPAEARFVAALLSRFGGREPSATRIIDMACGTGRHAFELAKLGFPVEGSDLSAEMVREARAAAAANGLPVRFHQESFQSAASIGRRFDAALAMFASLGYLTESGEFELACRNIASLLERRGVFIFDVWNGLAVLRDYSPQRTKKVSGKGLSVERVSRTALDEIRQIADVRFDFSVTRADGSVGRFDERHRVRFFFPREMNDLVSSLGFQVLYSCPFLQPDRALTPSDWNMTFVARKR